jgi:hypothetical protein
MLGGLWDSNVTLRNAGNPLIQEWVGTVSPRGEIDYNGRRLRFNAGYSGTLEAYRHVSELNNYDQRGRISTRYRATPRLQAEARASYAVSPTTDRLEIGTVPFVDIGGRSFEAVGAVTLAVSPRTQLAAEYGFQDVSFDHDRSLRRNVLLYGGYAHSPMARISHSLTPRITIGAGWQYRHGTIAEGAQHFNAQTMLGQAGYRIAEATSVTFAAGAAYLDISNTAVSTWGPSFHAGLTHELDRTSVSVSYSQSFVPSFGFGGLVGSRSVAAAARTPITRNGRLQLTGSVSYSDSDPIAELGVEYAVDSWWTNVSLGYQAAPWLRAEGFLSTRYQNSSARGNIDRTRVGIQFVTFKPVRIQ